MPVEIDSITVPTDTFLVDVLHPLRCPLPRLLPLHNFAVIHSASLLQHRHLHITKQLVPPLLHLPQMHSEPISRQHAVMDNHLQTACRRCGRWASTIDVQTI